LHDNNYQNLMIRTTDPKTGVVSDWAADFNGLKKKERGSSVYVVYKRCNYWSKIKKISLFYETDDHYLGKEYYSTNFLPEYKKFGNADIHAKVYNSNPREQVLRVALNDHVAEGIAEVLARGVGSILPYLKVLSYINPFSDKFLAATVEDERAEIQASGWIDGMPTRLVLHREYPIPVNDLQIYTQDAWFDDSTTKLNTRIDSEDEATFKKYYDHYARKIKRNSKWAEVLKAMKAIKQAGGISTFQSKLELCPFCNSLEDLSKMTEKYSMTKYIKHQACITVCYNAFVSTAKYDKEADIESHLKVKIYH